MEEEIGGGVIEVADLIWRVPVPLPGNKRPADINVYAIQDADCALHLVDAGWDTEEAWYALSQGLRRIGHVVEDVRSVTVTHLHRDHRGLAERLRQVSGATLAMHRHDAAAQFVSRAVGEDELDAWGVPPAARTALRDATPVEQPPTTVDRVLSDNATIEIPGRPAKVIHTPGHTAGSVCVALANERLVLTGDHVLPDQFPGIGLGGPDRNDRNHLLEYRRSLELLSTMGDWVALPGHGEPITNLPARIEEILRHHEGRSSDVLGVKATRPHATVWETAQSVKWSAGWDGLSPWHRISALRQTEMHLTAV
ncbi:MBL fold metallo-hydrolase [Arthrobacter methylotrophus]|uniref:MBL fold metallo-hydrolase n=2 Tax=Arthrobacter methylotrophus TaxID=121291 RepID=A0ABV5UMV1_9MICC